MTDWTKVPNQDTAHERGCTCRWWGRGWIAEFDKDCPILHTHHIPESHLANLSQTDPGNPSTQAD